MLYIHLRCKKRSSYVHPLRYEHGCPVLSSQPVHGMLIRLVIVLPISLDEQELRQGSETLGYCSNSL